MKQSLFVSGLLIFFFLAIGTTVRAAEVDAGKELYMQYCSSCTVKMDEAMVRSAPIKIKVPELTLLRKNNKGIYPMDKVMSAIDGRRTVRGHGDRKTPSGEKSSEKKPKAENIPSVKLSSRLNLSPSTLQPYSNSRWF